MKLIKPPQTELSLWYSSIIASGEAKPLKRIELPQKTKGYSSSKLLVKVPSSSSSSSSSSISLDSISSSVFK